MLRSAPHRPALRTILRGGAQPLALAMKESSSLVPLKRLWPYLRRYKAPMIFGIFCVMASNAFAVISPYVLQKAIDALGAGARSGYARYAGAILAATLLQAT